MDLESHSESVAIKASFILPSDFTWLMEKDGLIRCLRDHVKPSSVIFADPALLRHRITRHIFDLRSLWIGSVIRWSPAFPTVVAVSGRARWLAAWVKPLGTRHSSGRSRRLRNPKWPLPCLVSRVRLIGTFPPRRSWWWIRRRACRTCSHRWPSRRYNWWCLYRWWFDGWSGSWLLLQADRGSFIANWLSGWCFWRCSWSLYRRRMRRRRWHWCSCPWITTPGSLTGSGSAAFGIVMWGMSMRVSPQGRNTISTFSSLLSFVLIFLGAPVPFFAPFCLSFSCPYPHVFKDLQLSKNHQRRVPGAVRFTEPKILRN